MFVYLQYYAWLNTLKATLSSLNISFYIWKVREDYNVVAKWLSGNQAPPFLANTSETDLKKKASLK